MFSPSSHSLFLSLSHYIFIHIYHHHVTLPIRIFRTLSHHPSLLFIAPGRSSRLNPVSAQRCCMYILAGRPAFARLGEGVQKNMSLMRLSPLLHQCHVRQTGMVFVMGGRWPYSCFVGVVSRTLSILV